jgi:16S rRNA (guanine966-N2)-methyltransferase
MLLHMSRPYAARAREGTVSAAAHRPSSAPRVGVHTKHMTRVIAGRARGRRLAVPGGRTTRPTSDRAREAMFAAAGSVLGSWEGTRVLDLYAGSGAFGLEALSRGAAVTLLVEADPRAARVIRANIGAVGLPGAHLVSDRVERMLGRGLTAGDEPYDVAFADPPYALGDEAVTAVLAALRTGGWLAPGALVIVERAARSEPLRWPEGFSAARSRRYGEAMLWYGHAGRTVPEQDAAPATGRASPGAGS